MIRQLLIALLFIFFAFQQTHGMIAIKKTKEERLLSAIKTRKTKKIHSLLQQGANPNYQKYTKPLNLAAELGNLEICKLLLEHGADVESTGVMGITPLMNATHKGHISVVQLLLEYDADPNAKDLHNDPVLWRGFALKGNCYSVLKLLVEYGAKLTVKNRLGENMVQVAQQHGNAYIFPHLIILTNYNPILTKRAFQKFLESRARIYSVLMVFKRIWPEMPKDIKQCIFQADQELIEELQTISQWGQLKNISEQTAAQVPLPIVRYLLSTGQLDPEKTVDVLKKNHIELSKPVLQMIFDSCRNENNKRLVNPETAEETFGDAIERTIRTKLGLISWYEKICNALPQNPCILQ